MFPLDEQAQTWRSRAELVADELLSHFREADSAGGYSDSWRTIRERLHDDGFLSMYFPQDAGGAGARIIDLVLVQEAFGRHDGGFSNIISHEACASTMMQFGDPATATNYRAKMAAGSLTAICITEPHAGTDLAAMRTTARRESDGSYLITGRKSIISLAGAADILLVYAMTDPDAGVRGGISVFVVDGNDPGVSVGPVKDMLGYRLLPHHDLVLSDVRVPESARLGAEGEGLRIFAEGLNLGRLGGGAQALGLSLGALERAETHARTRSTMGRPIVAHQAIGQKVAQMLIDVESMRALTYATASWLDSQGDRGSAEAAMRVAIVKAHNTDLALRVTSDAVQVFGAQGLWRDNDVERLFRDAKVSQLVDGPNELMRNRISRFLAQGSNGGAQSA